MSALEGLATALESVVGNDALRTGAEVQDYAIDGVAPSLVVLPADEAQIGEVLRLAAAYKATVFPRGGGSHMSLGQPPTHVDLVLSVQRLQRQLAYEPADLTTTVQAGVCFTELQRVLRANGQFLALDPPVAATTTVGGIVATNLSGPRRLLYGTARDMLLGTAVISVDGTRTKAGGRVVKNVTGYDLNKLYIGSLGTLAILVELTWKLHPLPPGELTLGFGCAQAADLATVLPTVLQLPLRLSSLALLNAAACQAMAAQLGSTPEEAPYLLLVRLEGTPAVTQNQGQRLTEALRRAALGHPVTVYTWSTPEQAQLWEALAGLLYCEASVGLTPARLLVKVSLLMSDVPAFCQDVETLGARTGMAWPLAAHAGNGIVYVHIPIRQPEAPDVEQLLASLQALDQCVARYQGHRVLEQAPVAVKQHCQVWGPCRDDFTLMRAIKTSFDPQHRLNPGRFVGGL